VKVPKDWRLVDELPRNNTGKVLKKDLRARFGE
jgi:acyl-coenzyme A synthetase/AMP-(fatty) acid ligase